MELRKTKSISKLRDSSERTYPHSNFMNCGVIRKDERKKGCQNTVNEQDNEETVSMLTYRR